MIQTFKNAWKVPELRSKLLFTITILLLYRIGANLYVPYVNIAELDAWSNSSQITEGIFGFLNLLSGGAFSQATFFALSVSPYITASIVMQLLTIAFPKLEKLSKDELGRKKIAAATRWVTVGLALITAYGYVNLLQNYNGFNLLTVTRGEGNYVFAYFVMIACFGAGAAIIMWLAEKINEFGIGNGISIILFANIISRAGALANSMWGWIKSGDSFGTYTLGVVKALLGVVLIVAVIGFMVWFTNSERRIKIIYSKKVVGRKLYGGQKTNLPLKMNMAGVMPVIFASSIVSLPATIAAFFPGTAFDSFVTDWLGTTSPIYVFIDILLVFAFSYFYISISFNPVEVANNIRSQGGSIIGIRPQEMAPFIKKILGRVTLIGAVFLVIISDLPKVVSAVYYAANGSGFAFMTFFGTSLLILVGVALETVQDLEAQLSMRNYKGFLD